MRLSDITRKGMYIVSYTVKTVDKDRLQVTKMCTKKQFLKELSGMNPREITRICNTAQFEKM